MKMVLEEMSKEELIRYIYLLEEKTNFTYEDQIKLAILDRSPFTIWASDRNCIIKLWSGQCESMYGRRKEDVIGKDFVDLFVAQDEQAAARRDQLEIIDKNKEFHNIANDQGRNGNTLQLITNCFRITDPLSGEYWNAEMGLVIDYYEKERKQLEDNIAEGKLIQTCISNFTDIQRQFREQFLGRKASLSSAIRAGELDAVSKGVLIKYREDCQIIKDKISKIESDLNLIIENYSDKMKKCVTSEACGNIRFDFVQNYNSLLNDFDELVIDFEQIRVALSIQNPVYLKDVAMKSTTAKNTRMANTAQEMLLKAEEYIREYRALGDVDPNSIRLKKLVDIRDQIQKIKEEIDSIADDIYAKLSNANDAEAIDEIKKGMEDKYEIIDNKLAGIRKEMGDE